MELDFPQAESITLSASPNPFNPRVNIHFTMPKAGLALVQIFDMRGRLVRTLLNAQHPAGEDTVIWQGDDDSGRAMASGVYQVRLATEGRLIEERVTLLR